MVSVGSGEGLDSVEVIMASFCHLHNLYTWFLGAHYWKSKGTVWHPLLTLRVIIGGHTVVALSYHKVRGKVQL